MQSLRWPERRVDGGEGMRSPLWEGEPTPWRELGQGSVAGRPKSQCGSGGGVAYLGARSHTFPVRSSSGSCHSAWLSLPWLLPELLRSGTRHAIAKQPEAGYLEGTGGALAPLLPGGGRETVTEQVREARGSLRLLLLTVTEQGCLCHSVSLLLSA